MIDDTIIESLFTQWSDTYNKLQKKFKINNSVYELLDILQSGDI